MISDEISCNVKIIVGEIYLEIDCQNLKLGATVIIVHNPLRSDQLEKSQICVRF